jgi:hypothetical protein
MRATNFILAMTVAVATGLAGTGQAASVEAFANATVQPGGVRTGSSGLAFFNIEGSDFDRFASYGAARFDLSGIKSQFDADFGAGLWVVDSVALQLTQSNASFTAAGNVDVLFTADDSVSLAAPSPLTYGGFGASFPDAALITGYTFTEVSTGHVETHLLFDRLALNSAGANALAADVAGDSVTTLLLREAGPGVAATYAGYTNFTYAGPTLVVMAAAVPEPSTYLMLLAGAGVLAAAAGRRRR